MWNLENLSHMYTGALLMALGFTVVIFTVCYWDEINRPQGKLRMYRALRYFGNVVGCIRRDGTLYIKGDSPAVSYWEQRGFVVTGVEHSAPLGIPQVYFVLTKCQTAKAAE